MANSLLGPPHNIDDHTTLDSEMFRGRNFCSVPDKRRPILSVIMLLCNDICADIVHLYTYRDGRGSGSHWAAQRWPNMYRHRSFKKEKKPETGKRVFKVFCILSLFFPSLCPYRPIDARARRPSVPLCWRIAVVDFVGSSEE